jgi:hypothetical protein
MPQPRSASSGTTKSATAKPAAAKATTARTSTAKSGSSKSTAAKPAATKRTAAAKPSTTRSAAAKSASAKSTAAKPAAKRSTARASSAKPAAAKTAAGKASTAKAGAGKASTTSAAGSKGKPSVRIHMTADSAQAEAIAERARKLNEKLIEMSREAGESTLVNYEKALKAISAAASKGRAKEEFEWITHLAASQAKSMREVADSWAKAARERLK